MLQNFYPTPKYFFIYIYMEIFSTHNISQII